MDNCLKEVILCLSKERSIACKYDIDNTAQRPDIYFLVIGFPKNDFRCHVEGATQYLSKPIFLLELARKTKVSHLYDYIVDGIAFCPRDQYVIRFQISMDNLFMVHIVHSEQDLLHNSSCLSLGEFFLLQNVTAKIAPCNQLHHHKKVLGTLQDFHHSYNVRMLCLPENLKLLLHKFLDCRRRLQFRLFYDLKGTLYARCSVMT